MEESKKPFDSNKFEWFSMNLLESGCYSCALPKLGYACPKPGPCPNYKGYYKEKSFNYE